MTCPSQSSRFNHPDYIRWTLQTMKFLKIATRGSFTLHFPCKWREKLSEVEPEKTPLLGFETGLVKWDVALDIVVGLKLSLQAFWPLRNILIANETQNKRKFHGEMDPHGRLNVISCSNGIISLPIVLKLLIAMRSRWLPRKYSLRKRNGALHSINNPLTFLLTLI